MEQQPASRQLAEDLRSRITAGEYQPGDKLPTERALADRYGVARNTARESARLLAAEGLVTTVQGSGIYVRRKPRLLRMGSERYSQRLRAETGLSPYRAELVKQGRTAYVDCVSIERVKPPIDVTERLDVDATTKSVVRRENWYYADDEPMQVGITYVPWFIVRNSVVGRKADMGGGGIYARLEELGYPVARAREEISAFMPDPETSRGLAIPPGVPVVEVLHTSIDDHGAAFDVTRFTMRADHMGLDYNMPVED